MLVAEAKTSIAPKQLNLWAMLTLRVPHFSAALGEVGSKPRQAIEVCPIAIPALYDSAGSIVVSCPS